ncbi:MAG: hypothetical protein IJD87_04830 [Turicibacter sp.]|nr:hypothetical protein [Turicibacter sp.]
MKKWYYAIFLVCLYYFNQAFKDYVELYGLLEGLLVGLLVAFLFKLAFKVVTKTIVFVAILCGILVFLMSSGYLDVPVELFNFFSLR